MPMEAIYREHAQTVYRYLLARTGSPELAEELTQETFYQAVRSVNRFDGSCKVSTWLCAIAKNALRQYRRKHPQAAVLDESYPADDAVEQACVEKASRMELRQRTTTAKDTGRITAITNASCHWMVNMMARAPTMVTPEIKMSSGPW